MRKVRLVAIALLLATAPFGPAWAQDAVPEVEFPKVVLSRVPFDLRVRVRELARPERQEAFVGQLRLEASGRSGEERLQPQGVTADPEGGAVLQQLVLEGIGRRKLRLVWGQGAIEGRVLVLPGIVSVLPPVVAIVLALVTRQVLVSLFVGIWLGVSLLQGLDPFTGLLRTLDRYVIQALADPDHVAIVLFSMTLGGMVGVMSRSGGMQGVVSAISRLAKGPRGAQLAAWAMGVLVFFDDYANTLIVGNTMRPFTDRMRVSREKLSYIVDSTAAPVASVALISTWVGFQVGLVESAIRDIGLEADAYVLFLRSIPYSAYSLLTIAFVALVAGWLRDFGPMWQAEHRSLTTGAVLRKGAQPITDAASLESASPQGCEARWWNALLPILLMIVATLVGLYLSGKSALGPAAGSARIGEIVGAADSFDVLMWTSFGAAGTAIALAISQRLLSLGQAIEAWLAGVRAMVLAMVILVLAWSIGKVCAELHTADYVIRLARNALSPQLLPAVTFIVAALISFATGTSWATMAILVPIAVPMAHKLSVGASLPAGASQTVLLGTLGSVLSGSVFGDHCSPISDTTIMSSMASAADHVDHVRTQLPYAVLVASVSVATCYLPCGFGLPPWLGLILGLGVLVLVLWIFGKPVQG